MSYKFIDKSRLRAIAAARRNKELRKMQERTMMTNEEFKKAKDLSNELARIAELQKLDIRIINDATNRYGASNVYVADAVLREVTHDCEKIFGVLLRAKLEGEASVIRQKLLDLGVMS